MMFVEISTNVLDIMFIIIYIFAELYIFLNKNSEFLIHYWILYLANWAIVGGSCIYITFLMNCEIYLQHVLAMRKVLTESQDSA